LYLSPLFAGRRRAVETSCGEWYVLSALHGLVHPDTQLAPYDQTLLSVGTAARRAWAKRVLSDVAERVHLGGSVVEIHAGAPYRDFGLVDGLTKAGTEVVVPTAGMSIGQQLSYYQRRTS